MSVGNKQQWCKTGVGKKFGKAVKGVFKPCERVCILDGSGVQLTEKNTKFKTFHFAFLSALMNLHK